MAVFQRLDDILQLDDGFGEVLVLDLQVVHLNSTRMTRRAGLIFLRTVGIDLDLKRLVRCAYSLEEKGTVLPP